MSKMKEKWGYKSLIWTEIHACLIIQTNPYGRPKWYAGNSTRPQFKSCITCSCLLLIFKCSNNMCPWRLTMLNSCQWIVWLPDSLEGRKEKKRKKKEGMVKSSYWTARSDSFDKTVSWLQAYQYHLSWYQYYVVISPSPSLQHQQSCTKKQNKTKHWLL